MAEKPGREPSGFAEKRKKRKQPTKHPFVNIEPKPLSTLKTGHGHIQRQSPRRIWIAKVG